MESSTGPMLLGTSSGSILEIMIKTDDSRINLFNRSEERKPNFSVTAVADSLAESVCGLELGEVKEPSSSSNNIFILATTPSKLYEFRGKASLTADSPVFTSVFSEAFAMPGGPNFKHFPIDPKLKNFTSCLRVLHRAGNHTVAWMSGLGTLCGHLDFSHPSSLTNQCQCFPYGDNYVPLKIELLPFHAIMLYPDRIEAISVLNGDKICTVPLRGPEYYMGIAHDLRNKMFWGFTESSVYRVGIFEEERFVWKIYLQQERYDLALRYCPTDKEKAEVNSIQAEKYFKKGQYYESAHLFSKSNLPFEQSALKFINLSDLEGIKVLLKSRLQQDPTEAATALLTVWLIDLYLKQLGDMRDCNKFMSDEYNKLKHEFEAFLNSPKLLHILQTLKSVIYELMKSHNDLASMLLFAGLLKDQEHIIKFYMEQEDYNSALSEINKHPNTAALHIMYAEVLLKNIPGTTVDSWLRLGRKLDPRKLLPALLAAPSQHVLRYLETMVRDFNMRYIPIHNLLISLYANYDKSCEKLVQYIDKAKNDPDNLCFDPKYALRICLDLKLKKPSVDLYTLLGHYEEAVELALEFNIELAKEIAEKPIDTEEKRALWLCIARHVVEREKNVEKAMMFLVDDNSSRSRLNIEDILPFFPEFVTIDSFKDAICRSLDQYKTHMEDLRKNMDKCTLYSAALRERISSRRQQSYSVHADQFCYHCSGPAFTSPFLLFPCQHVLHQACLNVNMYPEDDCPFCGDLAIESIDKPL